LNNSDAGVNHHLMNGVARLLFLVLFSQLALGGAQAAGAKGKRGSSEPVAFPYSSHGTGNCIDFRKLKLSQGRDVARVISAHFGAIGSPPERAIDLALLEEKLRNLVGEKKIVCCLELRPTGRVESIRVFCSSGDLRHDKRAIALLRDCAPYGKYVGSPEVLSYRVEFPKLTVVETQRAELVPE
jgi:hypothetical protein